MARYLAAACAAAAAAARVVGAAWGRGGPQGPAFPECTGIMATSSASGSPHGPEPTVIYQASDYVEPNGTVVPPPGGAEWYSALGIDNPTLVILRNGSALLSGRTCSRTEHPWVASVARSR